jgi:hypothetical protein
VSQASRIIVPHAHTHISVCTLHTRYVFDIVGFFSSWGVEVCVARVCLWTSTPGQASGTRSHKKIFSIQRLSPRSAGAECVVVEKRKNFFM